MTLLEDLRTAGFDKTEISNYFTAERQTLAAAGFSDDEIAADLGAAAFNEAPVAVRAVPKPDGGGDDVGSLTLANIEKRKPGESIAYWRKRTGN